MWDVAVIIPVHNAEKTLERCLESLFAQTMKSFQIVAVNDGSTDQSAAILERYRKQWPDRMIVHHEAGLGASAARKNGIAFAAAPYVGFVDADDWVEPNYIETLYNLVTSVPGKRVVACCAHWIETTEGGVEKSAGADLQVFSPQEAFMSILQRGRVTMYLWDKLFDARILQHIRFVQDAVIGEDFSYVTQAVLRADEVLCSDKPLYHYVQIGPSLSKSGYGNIHKKSLQNYLHLEEEYCADYPECSRAMHNYVEIELLSFLVAMSRNRNYDKAVGKNIQGRTRMILADFLRDQNVARNYKAAALLTAVSWKWFCRGMCLIQPRS